MTYDLVIALEIEGVLMLYLNLYPLNSLHTLIIFSMLQNDLQNDPLQMPSYWPSGAALELRNFRYVLWRGMRACFMLMDVMMMFNRRCRWQGAPGPALRAYVPKKDAPWLSYTEQKQPPTE